MPKIDDIETFVRESLELIITITRITMKKVLISTFVFIMAVLPLGLLSSTINSNANSADVNHDGEVNISDINAVISIILGGPQEGYDGDVNNDGEINISDINYLIAIILGGQPTAVPVINTQTVDNAVIITATGNGNVILYVDGQAVSNPYVAIRGEDDYYISVYATAQEEGKLMSQCETIRVLIPAKVLQPTEVPSISTDITEDAVIITASGNGIVNLYVDGQLVDNPYTAIRQESDYTISVYATAQEEGKEQSQSDVTNIVVPAKIFTAIPIITTETTNEAVIISASGDGIVKLYVNDLLVSNPYIAVRSTVDYEITVFATAQEEGKAMSQSESVNVHIPALAITDTPVVTADTTENAVIITASGNGVVKLYVNDLLVENPYTALRNDVEYELTVYATAQEEGKAMSQSESQSIIVPALGINETETFTVNGVTFKMIAVEGGTFMMGAADDDPDARPNEKPAHEVTLSSYSIGETEVTQALWLAVMGSNPSQNIGDLNCPVESVSWTMCQEFITKLNQITGKAFRLPTEAEWEYAARGGNKSQGYKYAGSNYLDVVAWYNENSGFTTHPVATKTSNELGLFDMSGNVWEWCQDWYSKYSIEPQTNPTGPSTSSYRVNRGGIFNGYDWYCRVSFRNYYYPMGTIDNLGLRLALGPEISPEPEEHEWIDLGLPSGTLWATMNIGATNPEEYGDYFAWGETAPKEVYNWSTYKWCNGSSKTITKYCTDSYYGIVDNKTELEPEDDAAYVNWGESWHMPTKVQQQELVEKCTWTWTQQNGVKGRLVIGPNGNTLFLPAAGYRMDSSLSYAGSVGDYWSSILSSDNSGGAYFQDFDSNGVGWGYYFTRCIGFTVRAVRVP